MLATSIGFLIAFALIFFQVTAMIVILGAEFNRALAEARRVTTALPS